MFILYDEKFLDAMSDRLKASAASLTPKAIAIRTFIILRRHARNIEAQHEGWSIALALARRAMPVVQRFGSPLDLREANSHLEEGRAQLAHLSKLRIEIGDKLNTVVQWLEEDLTTEEWFDLLNVNRADRDWPGEDSPKLSHAIMVYGLEDSAAKRGQDRCGGPLSLCLNASMMHFMRTNPKGRATMDFMTDELFSPGGLFGDVPLYRETPDGSVEEIPASERAKPPAGSIIH